MHDPNCPPKLLPWLARKAGIPDTQAEALWRRALAETASGQTCADQHFLAAMSRLLELVAAAAPRQSDRTPALRRHWQPLVWVRNKFLSLRAALSGT